MATLRAPKTKGARLTPSLLFLLATVVAGSCTPQAQAPEALEPSLSNPAGTSQTVPSTESPAVKGAGSLPSPDRNASRSEVASAAPEAAAAALPATPADNEPLRLRFVGDVIFGRYRDGKFSPIVESGQDPFASVKPLLRGDAVVANLETPLVRELPEKDERPGYFFGATKTMASALASTGFTALVLANNHAADRGAAGLRETPELLRELGLTPLGAARPHGEPPAVETLNLRGLRLGMISATAHMNFELPSEYPAVNFVKTQDLAAVLGPVLERAKADHDFVVVNVHWGVEYSRYPESIQRTQARALIDRGADLVVGHHPHVLQEVELYGGGAIAYSLGNFLFENTSPEPRLSGVLALNIDKTTLCDVELRFEPVVLRRAPHFHLKAATGEDAAKIRKRIPPLSRTQRALWQRDGEALITHYRRAACHERAP